MKKIIVITASLLFAALVVLGNNINRDQDNTPIKQSEQNEFHARFFDQQLILEFESTHSAHLTVELYNLTGKRVGSWKVHDTTKKIYLDHQSVLRQGLYIVKVTDGKSATAQKFKI